MEEIPCKDCITLPVCKAIINTLRKEAPNSNKLIGRSMHELVCKCSLIHDYIPVEAQSDGKLHLDRVKVTNREMAHEVEIHFENFLQFFLDISPDTLKVRIKTRFV